MASDVAIGIDLGTSYSCVSVVENGIPRVIANDEGELIHASVVSFLDDGSVLVGNAAKHDMGLNPKNTISSAKRLIGRFFFSEEVKKARAIMPYEIVEGPNGSVSIRVRERDYSLPEVSALVLKALKMLAEEDLGREITDAVITVPAFFNDNQRQATRDAGRIAGLNVLRILNEPTAAALTYGCGQKMDQRVAVYDFGGGTFDVSILEIRGDMFEVLSTAGDTYLGGDDLDDQIVQWLVRDFKKRHATDLSQDAACLQKLREIAEKAKIEIGQKGLARIQVPAFCQSEGGQILGIDAALTEAEFNKMAAPIIQRTFKVCDEALQSAHLNPSEIDAVILVGGPTRLPIIRASVRHYFDREPLTSVDPDKVVSIGAALQAHALASQAGADYRLLDVTPLTLRIGTVGGFCEKIIDKNTPIPIEQSKTFTTSRDLQDKVRIRVYQGESNRVDECELLGEFEFSGFRVGLRGEVKIEVTFEIDTNGIVNVAATERATGLRASTTIQLSSGLSEADIAASRQNNSDLPVAMGT